MSEACSQTKLPRDWVGLSLHEGHKLFSESAKLGFMKYSQLERAFSPDEAAAYVGSRELLRQFEQAKWLKPLIRGNRLTRYDLAKTTLWECANFRTVCR